MRPPESFVGQPIRSLQTMLRVLAEDNSAYYPLIPDGIYGPETTAAVSVFQRNHGIPTTGITDQRTWEAIVAEYDPALVRRAEAEPLFVILEPGQVIRRGERHPVLYLAQSILVILAQVYGSIGTPSLNGLLDAPTADALMTFQGLNGLPMTGELDKITWKNLALQYPQAASRYWDLEEGEPGSPRNR